MISLEIAKIQPPDREATASSMVHEVMVALLSVVAYIKDPYYPECCLSVVLLRLSVLRLRDIPGVVAPMLLYMVESSMSSLASSKKMVADSPASFSEK